LAQTPEGLDPKNVQGIGLAGFRKDHQELLFLSFGEAKKARHLIADLAPDVASHLEVAGFNAVYSEIRKRNGDEEVVQASWMGLAVSASGLRALGADPSELPEGEGRAAFEAGMAARAEEIGDTRPGDQPAEWHKAFRPGAKPIHALVVLAADRDDDLERRVKSVRGRVKARGCEVVFSERGHVLPGALAGHEHFGFKDGVSQPAVAGIDEEPAPGEPAAVALGEFLLGHPGTGGETAEVPDLFRDGSFLVFRRLLQDVAAFRARAEAGVPGASPQVRSAELEAKMVGRWPSGTPLETSPESDPGEAGVTNAFAYGEDPGGERVPRFAHIRKVNPRDEARPEGENDEVARRRMIRRGLPFGPALDPGVGVDDGRERGLHFISIVCDLERQFEFVQRRWADDPNFPSGGVPPSAGDGYTPPTSGEPPDGPDPVIGEHDPGALCALHQPGGVHTFSVDPEVVRVSGGEYFFCPSITALEELGRHE
jgi:Dyp-type peroxidase family